LAAGLLWFPRISFLKAAARLPAAAEHCLLLLSSICLVQSLKGPVATPGAHLLAAFAWLTDLSLLLLLVQFVKTTGRPPAAGDLRLHPNPFVSMFSGSPMAAAAAPAGKAVFGKAAQQQQQQGFAGVLSCGCCMILVSSMLCLSSCCNMMCDDHITKQ
jgi:hypothetical protein